jgi:hypothetical protein
VIPGVAITAKVVEHHPKTPSNEALGHPMQHLDDFFVMLLQTKTLFAPLVCLPAQAQHAATTAVRCCRIALGASRSFLLGVLGLPFFY